MSIDFKADEFDFEKEFQKIKKAVVKPNILLCGATGVGKSSLVNDVFGKNLAEVGEGIPITRGIRLHEGESINLYDSEGYEIGKEKQNYYREEILSCIDKKKNDYPNDLNKHIHEVWYCISAANKRITETDIGIINMIQNQEKIPIAVIFTQVDGVDEEELAALKRTIKTVAIETPYFTYAVTDNDQQREILKAYIQKEELIDWAIKVLPDVLKEGLISALAGCIEQKRALIKTKIIPMYTASAGAVAVSPIPFSDAVLLMPIQLGMTVHIFNIYGLSKLKGGITAALESQILAQVGKFLATSIVGNVAKMIPGFGTAIGIAVNAAVAVSITGVLGFTISQMCYNYSKAVLDGRSVNVEDYFNEDIFNQLFQAGMKKEKK